MMMYQELIIVLVSVCAIEAQFRLPLFSQFIPSGPPPSGARSRILIPPPPPSQNLPFRLALSPIGGSDSLRGLRAPPPPPKLFNASPKLEEGPLRASEAPSLSDEGNVQQSSSSRDARLVKANEGKNHITLESTLTPFVATPTTIRFTLDDVPDFLVPPALPTQSHADVSLIEESLSNIDSPLDSSEENIPLGLQTSDSQQHLFILTSTENVKDSSTWKPSTPFLTSDALRGISHSPSTLPSILIESDTNFRPSFNLPFLDPSSSEQNLFSVVETKDPKVSSFLRSEAPHFIDSNPEIFSLNPVRVEIGDKADEEEEKGEDDPVVIDLPQNNRGLSNIPVPKPILFSEEDDNKSLETTTRFEKLSSTRKPFHFEQEFLSLLKKNSPLEKNRPEKREPFFEQNPFWFGDHKETNKGTWRLKGGERPVLDLISEDSHVVSHIAHKNNLGFFSTSIKGLTPVIQKSEEDLLSILDDFDGGIGITVKSFAQEGISGAITRKGITTVKPPVLHHNTSDSKLILDYTFWKTTSIGPSSHGPKIVPVGEVGEVPHEGGGATVSPVPNLSASLKHGVQSLNVTAWVSGCPKLYGKVELKCVIEHDASINTAMTLMWKKKSFTEGRPQEHVMTENDLLMMEDERFSLSHSGGEYVLTIKDFRAKDCGTYECEAKAADTTAASQLLLFTCL